jgi:uncharacterized protein (DUF305 family)
MKSMIVAAALAAFLAVPALAQDDGQMGGMHHGDHGPASQAFAAGNGAMMKGMGMPMTGDADQDFAAMMIVHHQGAIDMAKVELQYGKDPQLRKLAEDIIAAQEKEIAMMKSWQAANPAK